MAKYRLIKRRISYTAEEIAERVGVHVRTVQDWHRQGMKPIEERARPLLYRGINVRRFLDESKKGWRGKLAPDEFLCLVCKRPRKSTTEGFKCEMTGKLLGDKVQIRRLGICEVCGGRLSRLGSAEKPP